MTTYHEPPLQSRRAARAGERAGEHADATSQDQNVDAAAASNSQNPSHVAEPMNRPEPLNYATTSRPPLPQYDGQNLRPRRTVEPTEHGDLPPTEALPRQDVPSYRTRDFSPEGRRSAAPSWAPQYDAPQSSTPTPVEAPAAPIIESTPSAVIPVTPAAAGEHTMTRRELRALREANGGVDPVLPTAVPTIAPVADAPVVTAVPDEADVLVAPEAQAAAVDAQPAVDAPVAVEPAVPDAPVVAEAGPIAPTPLVEPAPFAAPSPQPSSRLDSALAEFDALAAGREPLPEAAPAPATDAAFDALLGSSTTGAPEGDVIDPLVEDVPADSAGEVPTEAPELVVDAEPEPESNGLSAFDALFQPPSASIPVIYDLPAPAAEVPAAEAPAAETPATEAPNPLLQAPAPQGSPALVPPPPAAYPVPVDLPAPHDAPSPGAATPGAVAPSAVTPIAFPPAAAHAPLEQPSQTVGHWSTQSEIDDAEQINESTISRSVGAGNGAITTSALVLPSVPEHAIGGPLGANGEILLTGSISLPDSLAELGAHPSQLDESDIDHLLDPGDHQVANTDSTPVRAIKAVSTHTASGGIITPNKPKGTRGFTILIVAASVMAVVVVGLLVAGIVSGTL